MRSQSQVAKHLVLAPSDYSHKVEVNSDEDNASSVSNREYEERIQDKKRQIQLLNKGLLGSFS